MSQKLFNVTIPEELLEYAIVNADESSDSKTDKNFGLKVIKNQCGEVERVDYYTNTGDLLKSIYYKGFSISTIKYYRNMKLYAEERYSDGKLVSKGVYNPDGTIQHGIAYNYNRQNNIISIEKASNGSKYKVEYGYDELNRVNSRKIYVNDELKSEQTYRFDILDRIVEYKDNNQQIEISQISTKNELISYKITDKIGNEMFIVNRFNENGYVGTDITLNNHRTTVKNRSYVDNVMLKKPYTTEDDLDLIIANLFNSQDNTTKRTVNPEEYIDKTIQSRVLPISIRKRLLYNNVVNI